MVIVNDKNIIVYNLDTIESIMVRIASELKTLPKYLYFPNGPLELYNNSNNNIAEDLLYEIKSIKTTDYKELLDKIENKLQYLDLDMYKDVFVPFIVFNKELAILAGFDDAVLLAIQEEVNSNNYFDTKINIKKIWDERKEIKNIFEKLIQENVKLNEYNVRTNKTLDETKGITYTDFEIENVQLKIFLNMDNLSIIEIFNLIQLNIRIPFASFNGFYKILKDYIPSKEWEISDENFIILKVCELSKIPTVTKYDNFTNVIIGKENNFIVLTFELKIGKDNLSRDLFITELLSLFPNTDIQTNKIEEKNVKGTFYFPKTEINNYILSDLIMNDNLFSSMMTIDEHDKATKSKNSVYIHFKNNNIGRIAANITEKVSERGDPLLKGKDVIDQFEYGSTYIRVKISYSANAKAVLLFQDLFSKLLSIYNSKYIDLVKIYAKFIPNFGVKEQKVIKKLPEPRLKDIAPEVFPPGYSKKCNAQPTIISDEEVEQAESDGKQVMTYPLSSEEGILPRNYVCNHEKYPYPGLRSNPLSNQELVPYLPCCFKRDHSNIEGNIYGHYFRGEELKDKIDKSQQNFIITNKFTPFNWYGYLPENLTKLFEILDPRDNYIFIRKGVSDTKNSFLECVMEAMWKETGILKQSEKNRTKILQKERVKLANFVSAALCKQEMYDFTTTEIINMINNNNIYFNPQYFTNLLETYFNCNIFVFNRKNMTINAQLRLPRFLKAYYKHRNNGNCIFIYEHMGSPSDHATEPRCELIIRWKSTDPDLSEYNFNPNTNVSKGIKSIFDKLRMSYSLSSEIEETYFPIDNPNITITAQGIDSYGKTRLLKINYKNSDITLLTSPMQPLNFIETEIWKVIKVNEQILLELQKELNITFESQNVVEDYAKTYNGRLGNVKISIPIEDTIPSSTLSLETGINYVEDTFSELENYNKYKKLSRYILSYTFWLYSKYLNEENKSISLDTIKSFVDKFITIIPDFEYKHVSKFYSMDSGVMYNSKLVLKSEETLKRIIYSLKLFTRQRINLLNYYKNNSIENYYLDLTDFDQYQFQVILEGENAVEKWVDEQELNYTLYDSVQIDKLLKPYFFKNNLVNNKIYLAQNTSNIQNAIKIARTWNDDGYNIGAEPELDDEDDIEEDFLLYTYKNSKDITPYKFGDINLTDNNIIILGYKVETESNYTVLLNL